MFKQSKAFLILFGLVLPSLGQAALWSKPTEVIYFTPPPIKGKLLFADCKVHSIAAPYRADAWRCMAGNRIYDPCFSVNKNQLICGAHPIKKQGSFAVQAVTPLSQEVLPTQNKPKAWILQLADKTICEPQTGTLPLLDNHGEKLALSYYCYNDKTASCLLSANPECTLMGLRQDSIITGKVWTAEEAVYLLNKMNKQPPQIKSIKRVKIIRVWQ